MIPADRERSSCGRPEHAHSTNALEFGRSAHDLPQKRHQRDSHANRFGSVNEREHVPDVRVARSDQQPVDRLSLDYRSQVRGSREIRESRLLRLGAIALDRGDDACIVRGHAQRATEALRGALSLPPRDSAPARARGAASARCQTAGRAPRQRNRPARSSRGTAQPAVHRGMSCHPYPSAYRVAS